LGEKMMPFGESRVRFFDWLLIVWTDLGGEADEVRFVWDWIRGRGGRVKWVWEIGERRVEAVWVCHVSLIKWIASEGGGGLGANWIEMLRGAIMRGEYERLMRMCFCGILRVEWIRRAFRDKELVTQWVKIRLGEYWELARQVGGELISFEEWKVRREEKDRVCEKMFELLWGGGEESEALLWGGDAAARGYWIVWWEWWGRRIGEGGWRGREIKFAVPNHTQLPSVLVALCRHHFNDATYERTRNLVAKLM
jgi:hypothetical protein